MKNLAKDIQRLLVNRHQTLATAESCTGGRIAAALTAVAGSSGYFQGSLVAYQNEVKEHFLGVSAETIAKHDVVSREVVEEMVLGACRMFGTDYAIATTGYAGPKGGSADVPIGTIWIGAGNVEHMETLCLHESSTREKNLQHATEEVLRLLLNQL